MDIYVNFDGAIQFSRSPEALGFWLLCVFAVHWTITNRIFSKREKRYRFNFLKSITLLGVAIVGFIGVVRALASGIPEAAIATGMVTFITMVNSRDNFTSARKR